MTRTHARFARAALLFGALALVAADPAAAFIRQTRQGEGTRRSPGAVVQAHWYDSELPLRSVYNPANEDLPTAQAAAVIEASADAWEQVATSYLTVDPVDYTTGPYVVPSFDAADGQNSVFFVSDPAFEIFPPGGLVIAFVRSVIDLSDGHTLDADLLFNDRDFFSSTSSPGLTPAPPGQIAVDLQSVLTHELGHYFSLDHTSVANATMIPFILNSTDQRTLELDDRAGLSAVYPESAARPGGVTPGGVDFAATTGTVSGTVRSGFDGSAVFGAHVEAIPLAAPVPEQSISAISGELTLRAGQGEFRVYGLPPGAYAVAIVPLDGVSTIASDANIGGVFQGIDVNFPAEFWNGPGESGDGFSDPEGAFAPVAVAAGSEAGGVDFVTNAFPGRVEISPFGALENFVVDRDTGFRSVRFDLPFEPPFTIESILFSSFTFDGQFGLPPVPAVFPSVRLCPMDAAGGPDLANPLFISTPFVGSPIGRNEVPVGVTVSAPNQTLFWSIEFPARSGSYPFGQPFLRMDAAYHDRGFFGSAFSGPAGGPHVLSLDRNLDVTMRCQLPHPGDVPIAAPSNLGANRRSGKVEFTYTAPPDARADGFPMPQNSLDRVELIVRTPSYTTVATAGAGAGTISVESPPPGAWILATQAVDRFGRRSLPSNVTILGLNEDSAEPNGRPSEATNLTLPVVDLPATLSPSGDRDFYGVEARPGDVLSVSVTATGLDGANDMDPVLFLLDQSGAIVALDDDSGPGLDPRIEFTVAPLPGKASGSAPRRFTIWVADVYGSILAPALAPRVLVPETYRLNASVTRPALRADAEPVSGREEDAFLFRLSGANPANPVSKLIYVLPGGSRAEVPVRLRIYDVAGRLVRTLVDEPQPPGPHAALWNGRDAGGREVASGNYYARLEAGAWSDQLTVTILK